MENTQRVNSSLAHHGVPGMKWGVRKARYSSSKSNGANSRKRMTSSKRTSGNSLRKKAQNAISKVDKEKVKRIAKKTAVIAGKVAVASVLGGAAGSIVINELFPGSMVPQHEVQVSLGKIKRVKEAYS